MCKTAPGDLDFRSRLIYSHQCSDDHGGVSQGRSRLRLSGLPSWAPVLMVRVAESHVKEAITMRPRAKVKTAGRDQIETVAPWGGDGRR